MATIKAYTDLEQSKKLAKILPVESADMYYEEVCNLPKAIVGSYILHNQNMEDKDYKKLSNPVLSPAWSLAALLNTLPKVINNETLFIETSTALWHIGYRNIYTARADNPVDACYELLLKLNEVNLL